MIFEQGIITADDLDVLNGTRLNAIPYNGQLTLEFCCNANDGTNGWTVTVQLPNGDVPVDTQVVTANGDAAGGVLDSNTLTRMSFRAGQGGHFTIAFQETGTGGTLTWRVVLA